MATPEGEVMVLTKILFKGTSALEIAHSIEQGVLAGQYPDGTRLPTVRELAEHLGVNKNTVNRAYQILSQRGYLEASPGRGAFVRLSDVAAPSTPATSDWQALLRSALVNARMQRAGRDQVFGTALRIMDTLYGLRSVRIVFVECNQPDVDLLSSKLQESIDYPVDGLVLSQLREDPTGSVHATDLVATSLFHLSDVRRVLGKRKDEIVGLNVIPALEALLDVARLDVMVIGIVCDTTSAQANLVHIVQTYHPEVTVLTVLASELERLQQLLTKVDAVIVTRSAADLLATLSPSCPTIVVHWTIDQQSVDFVRQKLEDKLWAADKPHLTSEWPPQTTAQVVPSANAEH
jgi:DNA-binding transcriptional regulator YhcF (GntR family)